MGVRVATDIGGTFTDLVFMRDETGEIGLAKVSSTPRQLEQGVLSAIEQAGFDAASVSQFVHGSTVVINAITERSGARVGLLTTHGMRDVLAIARGNRPDIYNLRYEKPKPFVPRRLRLEARGRMDPLGREVEPLSEDDVRAAALRFRADGVEAVAIAFLHSYANAAHEEAAAEIVREILPDAYLTISSRITKEWREYERTNTAVLNAFVGPRAARYLGVLRAALDERGLRGQVHVMQSNGGAATFESGAAAPINLVESGPVAGVIGAADLGALIGSPNLMTLDIGGTTAKCSLVEGGEVQVNTDYKLEWTPTSAGYPVKVPVVDIVEIGNGGGSIAWIDDAGTLRVGPRSAGAEPGPASYGLGGTSPTLTDANLIAGRLNPDYFLGGAMRLEAERAREAYAPLAERLGVSVEQAALGIIRLANANMVSALKIISVARGRDPRDFALVAMGGGGPIHSAYLARELKMRTVVVPVAPGHFSAYGMLRTDLRRDYLRTRVRELRSALETEMDGLYREIEREALKAYAAEGFRAEGVLLVRRADMRYRGQEHTISITLPGGGLTPGDFDEIARRFHDAHDQTYTFRLDSRIEVVNYHVTAFGRLPKPARAVLEPGTGDPEAARKGTRTVDFDEFGSAETALYDRSLLRPGDKIPGPAVVEEVASTTVVYPGMRLRVDDYGNLVIDTGVGEEV